MIEQVAPFEDPEVYEVGESFMLQNGYVRAEFNADGMLEGITTIDDRKKDQVKLVSMRKKWQPLQIIIVRIRPNKNCSKY